MLASAFVALIIFLFQLGQLTKQPYRAACTDKTWSNSSACLNLCPDPLPRNIAYLFCCPPNAQGRWRWWCGDSYKLPVLPCHSGDNVTFFDYKEAGIIGFASDLQFRSTVSITTPGATTAATRSSTGSSTGLLTGSSTASTVPNPIAQSDSSSKGRTLGMAVGIGVGIAIILFVIMAALFIRERKKLSRAEKVLIQKEHEISAVRANQNFSGAYDATALPPVELDTSKRIFEMTAGPQLGPRTKIPSA